MPFITEDGLKQLTPENYKYNAGKYTWLDNKMNPMWIYLADQLPLYMAPNLVTFVGFLAILSSYSLMLFYDTTLQGEIPSWLFLKAGIEVLVYQTLDAMDGKQARRTKKSSALGQLFDHGCDSFSLTFFLLLGAQATKLDTTILFYLFIGCQLLMFLSNWIEYHTHILNTQCGNFGVTEAELIVAALQFITYIKGQQFWQIQNKSLFSQQSLNQLYQSNYFIKQWLNLTICDNIAFFFIIVSVISFAVTFPMTLKRLSQNKVQNSKINATLQFIPYICCVIIEFKWFRCKIYYEYAGVLLMNFGILFSLIVVKLIVCSLTKMKFQAFHVQMLPLFLATLYVYIYESTLSENQLKSIFSFVAATNILIAFFFLYSTINQITQKLNINCFYFQEFCQKLIFGEDQKEQKDK